MYRENADPNLTTEIHALDVSTAKGGVVVGTFAGLSVVFLVAWLALAGDPPPEMVGWTWTMPAAAAVFAVAASLKQRRRRRRLQILRHGDVVRLVVSDAGVELEFPLECRGSQWTTHMNRVPTHEVYLQLVDGRKRSLLLHEVRGASYGQQKDWFPDNLNRSVISSVFDVSGAGTLATVRGWVEELEARRANDLPR